MKTHIRLFLCVTLVLCLLLPGCSKTIDSEKHIEQILTACNNPANIFPSDSIAITFNSYTVPDTGENQFYYDFHFSNVSSTALKIQVLGFYDPALEPYFGHHYSLQQGTANDTVTVEPGTGWQFTVPLTLLETWDSYTADEQTELNTLAKKLYFEVILEKETYYCILDFENQEVISVQ